MRFLSYIKTSAVILFFVIAGLSCSRRKNEADRKNIIPHDKFIEVLTDVYITDGLLIQPIVHHWYKSNDSIAAYRDVLQNHGYTKEQFDNTLRFYFIKRPKQLMKIYEKALAKLSEMQSRYDQEIARQRPSNYWSGRPFYASPGIAGADSTDFNIKFDFANVYYLTFTATVFPEDQAIDPKPVIYTCHPDSATTGSRYYINSLPYIKDGLPHMYTFQINDPDKTRTRLMGNLIDNCNSPSLERHFVIEEISITY